MTRSQFGQRFRFARIEQAHLGREENDSTFAKGLGVTPGAVTAYKDGDKPPPVARVLDIAKRCGVDPGWLAFGEDCGAPAPAGFAAWLANQPKPKERAAIVKKLVRPEPVPRANKGRKSGGSK